MAKHNLYSNTPEIQHDEDGHTKVVKPSKHDKSGGETDKGVKEEGFPIHARHAHERHQMHAKHEHEHAMHEHHHGVHGKEEMHTRHEHEKKEMHTRHEKEAGATSEGGEPIAKIEKETKHGQ